MIRVKPQCFFQVRHCFFTFFLFNQRTVRIVARGGVITVALQGQTLLFDEFTGASFLASTPMPHLPARIFDMKRRLEKIKKAEKSPPSKVLQ